MSETTDEEEPCYLWLLREAIHETIRTYVIAYTKEDAVSKVAERIRHEDGTELLWFVEQVSAIESIPHVVCLFQGTEVKDDVEKIEM